MGIGSMFRGGNGNEKTPRDYIPPRVDVPRPRTLGQRAATIEAEVEAVELERNSLRGELDFYKSELAALTIVAQEIRNERDHHCERADKYQDMHVKLHERLSIVLNIINDVATEKPVDPQVPKTEKDARIAETQGLTAIANELEKASDAADAAVLDADQEEMDGHGPLKRPQLPVEVTAHQIPHPQRVSEHEMYDRPNVALVEPTPERVSAPSNYLSKNSIKNYYGSKIGFVPPGFRDRPTYERQGGVWVRISDGPTLLRTEFEAKLAGLHRTLKADPREGG